MDDECVVARVPRLTNAEYMEPCASIRPYHQELRECVGVHWHEFYEVGFVVAGQGTHVVNGVAHPLTRGNILLLTPADFHEVVVSSARPLELYNVVFSDDVLAHDMRRLLFSDLGHYVVQFDGPAADLMEAEFRRLWEEVVEQRAGYRRVMQSTLERILIDVARRRPISHAEHPQLLERARDVRAGLIYMHHHFREDLSLDQVAAQAHLSPHYFSECFHRATGLSFQAYLQDLRLRFAQSLLRISDVPITDVCYASGYHTLSHFERAFKRHAGQSPRGFRSTRDHDEPVASHHRQASS